MQARSAHKVLKSLRERIDRAEEGARLPTVRALMREHGVGQTTVQEVIAELRDQGLISSQVGRGSFVAKPEIPEPLAVGAGHAPVRRSASRSLLILSNASMNERCVRVQDCIVNSMKATGGKVMQVSYYDTDHLLDILKSLPDFDATILQSHYEVIPVRLLAMLQAKTRALVADGHTVAGVDVDRMGIDWEEALTLALDHLTDLGHRRIALVSLDSLAQPILNVRRHFGRLGSWRGAEIRTRTAVLNGLVHPTQNVRGALNAAFQQLRDSEGVPEVTALILAGVSDGMGIREGLREQRLKVPQDINVVLLGHTDIPTEHLGLFTMAGGTYSEGAAALVDLVTERLQDAASPPQVVYLPCNLCPRESTAQYPVSDVAG